MCQIYPGTKYRLALGIVFLEVQFWGQNRVFKPIYDAITDLSAASAMTC